jgi:CheY-like chemotaxis protein
MNVRTEQPGDIASAHPILLVEDNPMDIDFALQAFEESRIGNPVVVCRDGEEAMAFVLAHTSPQDPQLPAVVLLDLHLPKVDGIDVLKLAREHPTWKRIPFVVLTSSRQDTDISRAYDLGANSYIVKPVSFSAFAEVVRQIKGYWLLTNVPPFGDPTGRAP